MHTSFKKCTVHTMPNTVVFLCLINTSSHHGEVSMGSQLLIEADYGQQIILNTKYLHSYSCSLSIEHMVCTHLITEMPDGGIRTEVAAEAVNTLELCMPSGENKARLS